MIQQTLKPEAPIDRIANQSFRDLHVWQKSMELARNVYQLAQALPRVEVYGLGVQLRRPAVSIPSNIAEGHGRMNPREFKRFLLIASGSNSELQTQLEIAGDLGLIDLLMVNSAIGQSQQLDKMLLALLRNMKNNNG